MSLPPNYHGAHERSCPLPSAKHGGPDDRGARAGFAVLLAVLTVAEQTEPGGLSATAESSQTTARITRLSSVLARIKPGEIEEFVSAESLCHFGYEISDAPYAARVDADTEAIATSLAHTLKMEPGAVVVGRATLAQTDFGYGKCPPDVIAFPVEGLVISTRLPDGRWLHAEIHPHEPHFQSTFANRFQRLTLAFVIVAGIAALFMYRLGKPLRLLTEGAIRFGKGLKVESLAEAGPPDLRRTIGAFNAMQQQVTEEVARRTNTLAALSHDLRTPLTALRVKAELVDDENVRADLIQSIRKMEAISASAIEFLQGEARTEPMRVVDLAALAESECADFEEIGATVHFAGEHKPVLCTCRPEAVSRALRNLIDNAVKYGGSASVTVRKMPAAIVLAVSDQGPGIAPDQIGHAIEPFVRLSPARENETGGFGLGLAVAKSVAEGHDGTLVLSPNTPHGLIASITIPSS